MLKARVGGSSLLSCKTPTQTPDSPINTDGQRTDWTGLAPHLCPYRSHLIPQLPRLLVVLLLYRLAHAALQLNEAAVAAAAATATRGTIRKRVLAVEAEEDASSRRENEKKNSYVQVAAQPTPTNFCTREDQRTFREHPACFFLFSPSFSTVPHSTAQHSTHDNRERGNVPFVDQNKSAAATRARWVTVVSTPASTGHKKGARFKPSFSSALQKPAPSQR